MAKCRKLQSIEACPGHDPSTCRHCPGVWIHGALAVGGWSLLGRDFQTSARCFPSQWPAHPTPVWDLHSAFANWSGGCDPVGTNTNFGTLTHCQNSCDTKYLSCLAGTIQWKPPGQHTPLADTARSVLVQYLTRYLT